MAIVAGTLEYYTVFVATSIIVVIKATMVVFVGIQRHKKIKEGSMGTPFVTALFILLLCMLLARVSFMAWDFNIKLLDSYYLHPGLWFWRVGMFLTSVGMAYLVFVTDRKILNFKFKGMFAYLVLAGGLFVLFFPINSMGDYTLVSTLSIIPTAGLLVVLIVFINIAIKTSGDVRKTAVIIILAFILYAISGLLVNAGLISMLTDALGQDITVFMYLLHAGLKILGIILMTWGIIRWTK